ncbi:MAG: FtsL-like putative cell division protein [Prolixibacteraceae bacterium]|jgi:cell division protein FtsL|nr:FtsL-like putative cell division protein [Prolixibacteraceae bacterium]
MATKKSNTRKVGVRQVLLGSVLLNREVLRWLPVVGMVAFLGLLMISNRFKGEKIIRATVEFQEEVKELRSESATIEAELMNMSRYSQVLKVVNRKGLGLKQPSEPPVKIKVQKL